MLTPDFSQVLGFLAGLRPYRPGGVRLEVESWEGRPLIHNYGHGGAGITLAPGSAVLAADLLSAHAPAGSSVAVLGAGLVGLLTAVELVARGYATTVYARQFSPSTTSDVAGGVWHPVEVGDSAQLPQMLSLSFAYYGASPFALPHRVYFEPGAEEPLPPQLTPWSQDSWMGTDTFLVLGTALLQSLTARLRASGVEFVECGLDRTTVMSLPQAAWVNCLGAWAGQLCGDDTIVPIRGQLVRLPPAETQLTIIHKAGYIISRPDVLLLGGTFEHGIWDTTPDRAACDMILEQNRAWFTTHFPF